MKRILFVCVENANRSQMAEAFARIHGGPGVEAFSAGSKPSGRVHPMAIEAMAELGYDLGIHRSQGLEDLPNVEFDVAVTMGCGDACPVLPGKRYVDWELEDPAGKPIEVVRRVRDEIERRVKDLVAELRIEPRAV